MMMLMKKKKKMMMLMKKKKKMMMLKKKKKKKMAMMTILSETDWVRNDKWTVLMEAASFGQAEVRGAILDQIRIFCKTLPSNLQEADCSIFTLSVGRLSRFVTLCVF